MLRAVLALIYAPAAALVLAGALAAAAVVGDLWRLGSAVATHALDTVPDTYDRLALAARVALVGGAFLALVCALVVVAVGCRGRHWWRLYLIPGVPLSVAAALFVISAMSWGLSAAPQLHRGSPLLSQLLTALVLADAVVVAAHLGGIGAGPLGTRRARLRARRAEGRPPARPISRQTRPIPLVRFGPRVTGSAAPDHSETLTTPAVVGVPTAEELRAASEPLPVASEGHENADAAGVSASVV